MAQWSINFIFVFLIASVTHAQSRVWTIEWKNVTTNETQNLTSQLFVQDVQDRPLLFLAANSPQTTWTQVVESSLDTEIESEPVSVESKKIKDTIMILIQNTKGKLTFTDSEGKSSTWEYTVKPQQHRLSIANNCKPLRMSLTLQDAFSSAYPARLSCKLKQNRVDEVIFSTLGGAEWFGATIFEASGKGERWKQFYAKDLDGLNEWKLTWGSSENKHDSVIKIARGGVSQAKQSPFLVETSLAYMTGQSQKNSNSEALSGIQAALSFSYLPPRQFWSLGGAYENFVYSLNSSGSQKESLSRISAWAGWRLDSKSFKSLLALGYLSKSIDVPKLQFSSQIEAPYLGVDIKYQSFKSLYGFKSEYAVTQSQGSFTDLRLILYWQKNFFAKSQQEFFVGSTNTEIKTSTNQVKLNAYVLGFSLLF